jgi:hypothetical protein
MKNRTIIVNLKIYIINKINGLESKIDGLEASFSRAHDTQRTLEA